MHIVLPQTMASLELQACKEGCSAAAFMDRAGEGIAAAAEEFIAFYGLPRAVCLLCGKGNNGGDAFNAGCHLLKRGYSVFAIQPESLDQASPLCRQHGKAFAALGGSILKEAPAFTFTCLILDGLFGTGFKGAPSLPYQRLIEAANASGMAILSVDIPSGLDGASGKVESSSIQAAATLFLELPKTGFFIGEGWEKTGKLKQIPFGLPQELCAQAESNCQLITPEQVQLLLPPLLRTRHKYQAGHVVGLAGSPGMGGAALLASLAALRGGAGIVHLLHPKGMENELGTAPMEVIKLSYSPNEIDKVEAWINRGDAVFIGPGLGRSPETAALLKALLPRIQKPCVCDADALNILSETAMELPTHTLLTPHKKEMERLLRRTLPSCIDLNVLQQLQLYAEAKNSTLLFKGAPTFIFHPQCPIQVNPTGDPGMATAGSGDVLTGLIASLMAQGLSPAEGAKAGAYLHGLAGSYAAAARGSSRGVMASDLIAQFGAVYLKLTPSLTAPNLLWI